MAPSVCTVCGVTVANPELHREWHHSQDRPEQAAGEPLGAVHACSGCGALVVDVELHAAVCASQPGDGGPTGLGAAVVEWLDSLDPSQIDQAVNEGAFDEEPTAAVLAHLRREAAAL